MKSIFDMFRGRKTKRPESQSGGDERINCAYCNHEVLRSEIHFRCTQITCRQTQINIDDITSRMVSHLPTKTEKDYERATVKKRIGERTVFRPEKFSHRVRCPNPDCKRDTPVKLCPHCWFELPTVLRDSKTLTIVGLRGAGKTCFAVALVKAFQKAIPKRFGGCLTFNDDNGSNYFFDKMHILETEGVPPGATEFGDVVQAPSIQMNVKFFDPTTLPQKQSSGLLSRQKKQPTQHISAASFVFHDPAGEWFGKYERALEINFMRNTDSVILLVDSNQLDGYLKQRGKKRITVDPTGRSIPLPAQALRTIIANMQGFADYDVELGGDALINKDVAVVVTKADVRVFNQEPTPDSIALQKRPYSEEITESVSNIVRNALMSEDMLNAPEIVTLAENHFANVRFFAVSSLGDSVLENGNVRPGEWSPKRVEDPFLWIMHQWGLI